MQGSSSESTYSILGFESSCGCKTLITSKALFTVYNYTAVSSASIPYIETTNASIQENVTSSRCLYVNVYHSISAVTPQLYEKAFHLPR